MNKPRKPLSNGDIPFSIRFSPDDYQTIKSAIEKHNQTNPAISMTAAIKWSILNWARSNK